MTVSIAGLRPSQWRILNRLNAIHVVTRERWPSVYDLLIAQNATPASLVDLEERGFVSAKVGGTPVVLADTASSGYHLVTVQPTSAGIRKVTTEPRNLVLVVLAGHSGTRQVRHVLHEADANDRVLKALDMAGLIHGCGADHQPVPLTTFRHIPPLLMLHLTRRGRLYTSR